MAPIKKNSKVQELKSKTYRLVSDRAGKAFILKVGYKRDLLIFDEAKGYNRAIRYCPNERSIFVDEQSEHAIVEPIIIESGYIETQPREVQLQTFLDAHPDNTQNGGNVFEPIDAEQEAQEELKNEDLIIDIKAAVREKEKQADGLYALESLAAVLKGSLESVKGMTKPELKREIYNFIDDDPERFVDNKGEVNIFNDPEVQTKYIALKAIADGIIVVSSNNRNVMWADKSVILSVPYGVRPSDHLANYLCTDEGSLVLDEIERRS